MGSKYFTINDFNKMFPDEKSCFKIMSEMSLIDVTECPKCKRDTKFHRVRNRRCFSCQYCAFQLYPFKGTVFERSSTPLRSWLFAIYLFSVSKNSISSKELQRQLGVTYKTAWRMGTYIRTLFKTHPRLLHGIVEMDETYIGGKGKYTRRFKKKIKVPVFGMVERNGNLIAKVVHRPSTRCLMPIVMQRVSKTARLVHDDFHTYRKLHFYGYKDHEAINHSEFKYMIKKDIDIHTNTIEGVWSQLKRTIKGTFGSVRPAYLQLYVNEFAYRYNARNSSPSSIFYDLSLEALKKTQE